MRIKHISLYLFISNEGPPELPLDPPLDEVSVSVYVHTVQFRPVRSEIRTNQILR